MRSPCAANDALERRVGERTRTLSAVNCALEGEMRERRAGEERYRAFFETAASGAAECNPVDALSLHVDDALCRSMSCPRDDLLGRCVTDLTVTKPLARRCAVSCPRRRARMSSNSANRSSKAASPSPHGQAA